MVRHLGLRAFNDVVLRSTAYGVDVDTETYDYFDYWEKPKYTLMDRLIDLTTRPYYQTSMGAPQFLHNITGLSLLDLLELDIKTIDRIEKSMEELAEVLNSEPPKMDE